MVAAIKSLKAVSIYIANNKYAKNMPDAILTQPLTSSVFTIGMMSIQKH